MVKRLLLTTSFCRASRNAMFQPMYSSLFVKGVRESNNDAAD